MKLRLVAVLIVLLTLTGCSNILDKVVKKQPQPAQPAVTTSAGNPDQVQTDQTATQEFSLQDIQAALKDAQTVKLVAQDSSQNVELNTAQRDTLSSLLANSGELKENKELAAIVANPEFPNYQLQIPDKNITLNFYDSLHLGFGENSPHYYMETGSIWNSLNRWLPPTLYAVNQTGYLFKADKLTILGGSFAAETDISYAKNTVLRKIRSIKLERTTLPETTKDPIVLTFSIRGQNHSMKIYDDYVTYHEFSYKYPAAKQEIETLLSSN